MLDMNFTFWSWEAGRPSEGCGEEEEELSGSKVLLSFGTVGRAEEGTGVPCSCSIHRNSCRGQSHLILIRGKL